MTGLGLTEIPWGLVRRMEDGSLLPPGEEVEVLAGVLTCSLRQRLPDAQPVEPLDNGYTGFLVRTLDRHTIEVHRMIFNWRLARLPRVGMPIADRYWCYKGLTLDSLILAVTAAWWWDGSDDTEPAFWHKSGQTGEVRELGSWL